MWKFENAFPPSWEAHGTTGSVPAGYRIPCHKPLVIDLIFLAVLDDGWKVGKCCLEIDRDDLEQVKNNVQLLLRGCRWKKHCNTKRCTWMEMWSWL